MIPERFKKEINAHLMGNYLNLENYPLILAIFGNPGMGKTWQLRSHLSALGVKTSSIPATDLESNYAGHPTTMLKECYYNASCDISKGVPSALIIDDIDTTVGEWENNTGTVNHQLILAFFMHIADNPAYLEDVGKIKRVPIFFTGNKIELLYEPLRRPGRTKVFTWNPNLNEKRDIINSIFDLKNDKIAMEIIKRFPDKPISFFSDAYTMYCQKQLSSLASNASLKQILSNDEYCDELVLQYKKIINDVKWANIFQNIKKIIKLKRKFNYE